MGIDISESTIVANDWLNGRRTPDANQRLKSTITGLSLGSTAPMIFRAPVEAELFGAKAIADRFLEKGIGILGVVGVRGISHKSPFVMQALADVMGMSVKVAKSTQCCALGTAMFGALAAGIHENTVTVQQAMGQGFCKKILS